MERRGIRGALRIAGPYALFGALWIAASDRALELLVSDPHRLSHIQTFKGWAFVAASAALIAFVASRELRVRLRVEESLRASEERYRTLLENANDAILVLDAASGVVLDANKRAAALLGRPREEIVGMEFARLHPPEDAERCAELLRRAVEGAGFVTRGLCVLAADGRRVPVEIGMNAVSLAGRTILLGILRDVTERRAAEEALRREKDRAQLYLDIAAVIILVIAEDERVQLINQAGSRLLGFPEGEIVGRNMFDTFVPERLRAEAHAIFKRLLAGEEAALEYFEFPILARDGQERLIAWRNALVRDDAGRPVASISSGSDITERTRTEAKARARLRRLAVLHSIDLIISSTQDLHVTLAEFIDHVVALMEVDAVDILLLDPHTQTLAFAAGSGFRTEGIRRSRLRLGEGIAGVAALERRSVQIPDLRDPASGFVRGPLLDGEGFTAYYGEPLLAKGRIVGVLEILHRAPLALDEEQVEFLHALASQAAIAIDGAALFEDLQRSNIELTLAYDATLEGWARALDLRNRETERHSERVTEVTVRLARSLGVPEAEVAHIRRGALLHDMGKLGIPDSILLKKGPLTDEERQVMQRHPTYAFEILRPIAYLRPALDIPYCHHERWDGTGYPRGLKGEQIPLAARIFSVVDVWDALRAPDRPYRTPMSEDEVRAHLRSLAGTYLDPAVVEAFLALPDAPG